MKTETKKPTPAPSEHQRVLWHRYENFKELLPDEEEECLQELTKAEQEISPHDIEKLLRAGCPPDLAVKILKPL